MSCISINLIAVLRMYYKDEADKISGSECKKFDTGRPEEPKSP